MVAMEQQGLGLLASALPQGSFCPDAGGGGDRYLRQQGRAVFQFLLESVRSHLRGTSPPSLFEG